MKKLFGIYILVFIASTSLLNAASYEDYNKGCYEEAFSLYEIISEVRTEEDSRRIAQGFYEDCVENGW